MISAIVEVSDKANWAKLSVSQFDEEELNRRSHVDGGNFLDAIARARRVQTGDVKTKRLVVDLQTEEGAWFNPVPGQAASLDLDRHQIWVCPLFLPFLEWLYANSPASVRELPAIIELPPSDTPQLQGYRRPGPAFDGIGAIRERIIGALRTAASNELPASAVQLLTFADNVLNDQESLVFRLFINSHQPHEANRWFGAILMDTGRYLVVSANAGQIGLALRA